MKTRYIGELEVSPIGMGCMGFTKIKQGELWPNLEDFRMLATTS